MRRRAPAMTDQWMRIRVGPRMLEEIERIATFLREHRGGGHRLFVEHAPGRQRLVCSCGGHRSNPRPAAPPGLADLVEEDLNDDDR